VFEIKLYEKILKILNFGNPVILQNHGPRYQLYLYSILTCMISWSHQDEHIHQELAKEKKTLSSSSNLLPPRSSRSWKYF